MRAVTEMQVFSPSLPSKFKARGRRTRKQKNFALILYNNAVRNSENNMLKVILVSLEYTLSMFSIIFFVIRNLKWCFHHDEQYDVMNTLTLFRFLKNELKLLFYFFYN
ncbi:hypothetical protein PYW08_012316 [Mythimna loreyi]|uniref:Uncharacterized protein n=1 Tax=Mythimna loreyi TaxID=667449 RepID=A0ACC2Q028_9NEOP|nr:hypothetical protein PYW08_012316 [Mythimna loreyi]